MWVLYIYMCSYTPFVFWQTEARRSRLSCRYRDGNHNPRLLLKPVKEEDEWDSPRIVRYLSFLSDEEIETIKELAKPRVRHKSAKVNIRSNFYFSKTIPFKKHLMTL